MAVASNVTKRGIAKMASTTLKIRRCWGMVWSIETSHLSQARLLSKRVLRTPLVPAPGVHPRAWVKWESEQQTGSFKVRGAMLRLLAMTDEQRRAGVVAASAGNHGLGLAHAARLLGVRAEIVLPPSTPAVKRGGIAAAGAEVRLNDEAGYDAAEATARALAEERGAVFVSPFDDPWVAAGNGGSVAFEILEQLPSVGGIVFPVGGGGLGAGIAAAWHRGAAVYEHEAPSAFHGPKRLLGVQSQASPAMHRSLASGETVLTLPAAETLAEGLEGGVSPGSHGLFREFGIPVALVNEEAIRRAMVFCRDALGQPVEGSGAVGIAWLRESVEQAAERFDGDDPIVVVVTGRNVDPERLAAL